MSARGRGPVLGRGKEGLWATEFVLDPGRKPTDRGSAPRKGGTARGALRGGVSPGGSGALWRREVCKGRRLVGIQGGLGGDGMLGSRG